MQTQKLRSVLGIAWLSILAIALIGGGFVALWGVIFGIGGFNIDDVVFWGLPMAGYLYFVLIAAGLTVLSSLPTVFGLKSYYPLAKRAGFLAMLTLAVGLMCKGLDLGPWTTFTNLHWVFFSPNLQSPIWWMAMLYLIYFIFVVVKFVMVHKGRWHSHGGKEIGVLVLMLSGLSYVALSILFGSVDARSAYFGPYMSIYFIVTALLCGCAVILLADHSNILLSGDAQREDHKSVLDNIVSIFRVLLLAALFMSTLRYSIGIISLSETSSVLRHMAGSSIFIYEVLVGLLLPSVLLLFVGFRRSSSGLIIVSLLTLLGMLGSRLGHLTAGNLQPIGVLTENRPDIVTYSPSLFEWGIIVFALAIVLTGYAIGVRWLCLQETPDISCGK